ncbi:MAG: phosphate ABC transporter substrate-binding protein PstS [Candidatus Bathyarchaeota archaeon]|nr:phosphate ABC transporter substrate-binding protein PstS [Candidatus Bathyarchaeota archaeon]
MKNVLKIAIALVAITIITGSVLGYIYFSNPSQETAILNGSGATFPYPLLDSMITKYKQVKSNVQINYQAIGSGGGITALTGKTVDFAASDAPLSAADREKAPNVLHIPETIGAVTVAYNIPNVPTGLHMTGKVIADIFQGKVTKWNDPAIQNLNTGVTLPDKDIIVVHRSDGSGTTFIFTGYLSAVSSDWKQAIGQGKTVAWPIGLGANGNTGVAGVVQGTPYTIGYVELAYALQNNMTVAAIQNPAGNWILPSLDSTKEAVQSAASKGLPAGSEDWSHVNVLNAPGSQAYPIVSFTYLLVYKELNVIPSMTQAKATALVHFLWWVIHDGQQLAPDLEYAQLPSNVVQINEASIKSITFNGQQLPTT